MRVDDARELGHPFIADGALVVWYANRVPRSCFNVFGCLGAPIEILRTFCAHHPAEENASDISQKLKDEIPTRKMNTAM